MTTSSPPAVTPFAIRLAETLISNREVLTNAIVESCPVPMFVADNEGSWLLANEPYLLLLGRQPADVVGNGWLSTLTPRNRVFMETEWVRIVRERISARHLLIEHVQPGGMVIHGYACIGHVHVAGFVGWFVPICDEPKACPVHGYLLHNVPFKTPKA